MKVFGIQVPGLPEPEPAVEPDETDLLDDPETEEGEGAADPLADFDEGARQEIEALIAQREEQARQQLATHIRGQAQQRGFDFAQDGSLLVADYARAQTLFPQQPAAQAPAQPAQPVALPAVDLTRIPDPTLEPEAHQQWLTAYVQQQTAGQQQAFETQLKQQQFYTAQLAANHATARVTAKLGELGFANLAQHPEFVKRFQDTLMGIDMAFWQDDTNLARMALGLIPDLGPQTAPPTRRPKSAAPAPQPGAVASSIASRAGAEGGFIPSGRSLATTPPDSGSDALFATALGISVEEVRALRDQSGGAYTTYKEKQRRPEGTRRR